MKETGMQPALATNLVANSGNNIYGVSVIQNNVLGQHAKSSTRAKIICR